MPRDQVKTGHCAHPSLPGERVSLTDQQLHSHALNFGAQVTGHSSKLLKHIPKLKFFGLNLDFSNLMSLKGFFRPNEATPFIPHTQE